MKLLSLIIPFHNSAQKCSKIIKTLSAINAQDIEIICIDDGSEDKTIEVLYQFRETAKSKIKIISQENKGPGGARNAGLAAASGIYVWFADSDDNVFLDSALTTLRENISKNYDFIDFNYIAQSSNQNSMHVEPGEYSDTAEVRRILLENMGRIWTKLIRKDLLTNDKIKYPEYCLYEDNPFIFFFPFHVRKFLKTSTIAYEYIEENPSITRSSFNPRFFDRLYTALWGLKEGKKLAANEKDLASLEKKYTNLFLINSLGTIFRKNPLTAARLIKLYRQTRSASALSSLPREKGLGFKTVFLCLWAISHLLPDQSTFLERQRLLAWNRPFPYGDFKSLSR